MVDYPWTDAFLKGLISVKRNYIVAALEGDFKHLPCAFMLTDSLESAERYREEPHNFTSCWSLIKDKKPEVINEDLVELVSRIPAVDISKYRIDSCLGEFFSEETNCDIFHLSLTDNFYRGTSSDLQTLVDNIPDGDLKIQIQHIADRQTISKNNAWRRTYRGNWVGFYRGEFLGAGKDLERLKTDLKERFPESSPVFHHFSSLGSR